MKKMFWIGTAVIGIISAIICDGFLMTMYVSFTVGSLWGLLCHIWKKRADSKYQVKQSLSIILRNKGFYNGRQQK